MKNFYIQPINSLTQTELWDQFIDDQPEGTIFHKYGWLTILAEETNSNLYPLCCYKGSDIVGILPLFQKKSYGVNFLLSPPKGGNVGSLGIVLKSISNNYKNESFRKQVIYLFLDYINSNFRYDLLRIVNGTKTKDIRPFIWKNFNYKIYYTYIINLNRKLPQLYSDFKGDVRTNIRKSENIKNLVLKDGELSILRESVKKMKDKYLEKRKNFGESYSYYDKIYARFKNNLILKAITVKNELVTSLVVLQFKDILYYWFGGVKTSNKNFLSERLHWEIIKSNAEENKYYDLMGANNESISHFKSKFNPVAVPFFEVYKYNLKGKISYRLFFILKKSKLLRKFR